jgi:ER lumen protein retaining receptor
MMQKARVVERFTANYVFALGVARFFSCAHWILQVFEGTSYLQTALGKGIWPLMVLTSEVVQTGILADFCYYYIQSWATGESSMTLPV